MSFRVGIDGYNLAMTRGTGVATYGRTLARAVREAGHPVDLLFGLEVSHKAREDLRESLFYARLSEGDPAGQKLKMTVRRALMRAFQPPFARDMVPIPVSGRVVATEFQGKLPEFDRLFSLGSLFTKSVRHFRRYKKFMTVRVPDPPKVMHWTYPVPVRLEGAANIYTIHDLVPLRLPHTSLEDKRYYDALIGACVAEAAAICTVSEASRRDILELFPTDPEKVVNTWQPVDIADAPQEDAAALRRRLGRLFDLEPQGYFLFFGAIEPKKNVGRLIEAYLSADIETPLVIVGAGGWKSEEALRLLGTAHGKTLSASARVRVVDYLPRGLLIELIRGARAVTFPSLYEGFGLPALEALALGAPLLTSNTSSLPEVVGDAALMVDPYDVAAIAEGLRRLDGDSALRAELAARGPKQAGNFSAARYGHAIETLYRAGLARAGIRD
ncbi:glycosyltransferase family 4 protein [Sphingomonas quercus]|uniref:Glycosyltransferase family 4 protein n=1 Tax=Sphingomonas quercus TaxID=2842451 RepID=A0ABS6BH75_9SPHN|nr:glycosyltransferase family 1 protein [Sphingomonas quercus]MBU3077156.1 glycosyltransferase family 4 protein [Sphingomonas quercus]